jgi:hypothetical protein
MSIGFASALLQRLGPCHIFMERASNRALVQELVLQGCAVSDVADAAAHRAGPDVRRVGILQWPGAQEGKKAIARYASMDTLVLSSGNHYRPDVDSCLFANGWQRHTSGMMPGEHAQFSDTTLPGISYYQKLSAKGHSRSPLRQTGADADLFLGRCAQAASYIRRGDHVLIDGEGYADIAALVGALSYAGSLTCVVDRRAAALDAIAMPIATTPADLSAVADNSIDIIVALEPAIPATWRERLQDYDRVLRHDGRLVLGWKVDDRCGQGLVPASWAEFHAAACQRFLPEARIVQQQENGRQLLTKTDVEGQYASDWMILVAAANPLGGEADRAQFTHPAFAAPQVEGGPPAVIDFAAGYDNPYLYRSMIQIGERLNDEIKLSRLAEYVIEHARPGSADQGSAIGVLGYRILEQRMTEHVPMLIGLIDTYLDNATTDEPHVIRWRMSLMFLAGRLAELVEARADAIAWYHRASVADWSGFSPLLATKAVGAAFYEGRLHLSDGDMLAAKACFQRGVATTLAAAQSAHSPALGDPDCPVPFYLTELAEVMDMGSQCANAVANLPMWSRDPGAFWRTVDIRRFGLNNWARDLQRENEQMRAAA